MLTVPPPPTGISSTQGQLLVYFAEKGSLENCNFHTIYATESVFSEPETQCRRAHGELTGGSAYALMCPQSPAWCVLMMLTMFFFCCCSHSHSLFHAQTRGGGDSSDLRIYKSMNEIDNESISSVTEIHIIGNRALAVVGVFVAKNALVGRANV